MALQSSFPSSFQRFDRDSNGYLSDDEMAAIAQLPASEFAAIQENAPYQLISEILVSAKYVREKLLPSKRMTFEELRILAFIYEQTHENEQQPEVTQVELCDNLQLSSSTVSSAIDRLDADLEPANEDRRRWIKRTESQTKRSAKSLALTPDGLAAFFEARDEFKGLLARAVFPYLTLQQILNLRAGLFNFNKGLDPSYQEPKESATPRFSELRDHTKH